MLNYSTLLVLLALNRHAAQGFSIPATHQRIALATPRVSSISVKSTATDSLDEACDPSAPEGPECADAITDYLDALSKGDTPNAEAAEAISKYVDSISEGEIEFSSKEALESYLEKVASGEVAPPSSNRVETYMDAMKEGMIARPSSEAQMVSCLSNPQDVGKSVDRSNRTKGKISAASFKDVFQGSGEKEAPSTAANREYNDVMRNVKEDKVLSRPAPQKSAVRAYNDVVRTVKQDRPLAPRSSLGWRKPAAAEPKAPEPAAIAAPKESEPAAAQNEEEPKASDEEKPAAAPPAPATAANRSYNDVMRNVKEDRNIARPTRKRTSADVTPRKSSADVTRSVRPQKHILSNNSDPNRGGIQPSSNQSDVGRSVRETKSV